MSHLGDHAGEVTDSQGTAGLEGDPAHMETQEAAGSTRFPPAVLIRVGPKCQIF